MEAGAGEDSVGRFEDGSHLLGRERVVGEGEDTDSVGGIEGAEQTRLDVHGALDRITEAAAETQASADRHRALHLAGDRDDVAIRAAKGELRTRLDALGSELDRYLAQEYGIDVDDGDVYEEWLSTHEPFHWAVEFYGVMAASMS